MGRRWTTWGAALAIAVALSACATTSSSVAEPPLPPGKTVTVKPGESLRDIADDAGLAVDEIVEVNGLRDEHDIVAGQSLFLPATAPRLKKTAKKTTTVPSTTPKPVEPAPELPPLGPVPFAWPVDGVVMRDFTVAKGKRAGYDAILIAAPAGTVVKAAAAGTVSFAGTQNTATGIFVVVDHRDYVTIYAHLARVAVNAGDVVASGDAIGEIGASGLTGVSPRLQFQVRKNKAPVDPLPLLPR